jgi:hypothetical protein
MIFKIAGGDMIITGTGNIYENAALEYRQVPIMIHLMEKVHVLGLIIYTVKTNRHFVNNHEIFGTLKIFVYINRRPTLRNNLTNILSCFI